MSLSVLEAISCGLYVFATHVSGNKDWEKDKKPAAWPSARDVTWNVCGKGFTVPI